MNDSTGKVFLVGAGPGDPDLITVRGLRLLRSADVVVHDRLVALELLEEAGDEAEVINVGKHPGFQRYTQDEINKLLVDRARCGLDVVRLKGGDPFVFARGGEEVLACVRAGVAVFAVPGVSSVNAVPAAAGVPLTHRGIGRSFAVITGAVDKETGEADIPFDALAQIDTIVILMGRENLARITTGLLEAGCPPQTPATTIESGCTSEQRVITATLATLVKRVEHARFRSPVVTVVGEVAAMASAAGDLACRYGSVAHELKSDC